MGFVSSQSLPKLLCTRCKRYLSYFPIYDTLEPKGTLCGRCPSEYNAQRNVIYEALAKSQLFPCCHDANGCTENLLPANIPQHEKFCFFRKYDCPTSNSTGCKWQGFANELLDHFEKTHRIFVLNPEGFEVDFISGYNENCLLQFEDGLFIVNRTNNPRADTVSYSVSYIGTNPHAQNYTYKVILSCLSDRAHPHVIDNDLTVKTVIERDVLLTALNNPNTVITQIEIVKPKESEDTQQYTEVNTSLLREVECSDCFEYMLPPIQQCITGHSICSSCKARHTECPTCKKEFNNTINITLGHLIEHLIYPCRNEGCRFTCKAKEIRKHEERCIFGLFKCPLSEYENCEAQLPFVKIYDHILNNHYENLLEMDTVHIPFVFVEDGEYEDCYIIKHDFDLFALHCLYRDGAFYWAMQQIGSQEKKTKYKFEIDVIDNSGNNCRVHFRADCGPAGDKADAFEDGRFFISLDYQQIKGMIADAFSYRVRIFSDRKIDC